MLRRLLLIVIVLLAAFILMTPALAGGWAVISLDTLPGDIISGQPTSVGFKVLQHGRTPLAGLDPLVHLKSSSSDKELTVDAKEDGEIGHYSATFTLPVSGRWRWSIQAFNMDQPMPELVVAERVITASASADKTTGKLLSPAPFIIGIAGIGIAGIGVSYLLKRRSRWAIAAIITGLFISLAAFARAGSAVGSWRAAESEQSKGVAETFTLMDQGEALFVAKGCVSCHINDQVDSRYYVFSTEIGPNLSKYQTSPEYMHLWLSDPAAIKPKTEMPNLGLSQAEIDALSVFLLQDNSD